MSGNKYLNFDLDSLDENSKEFELERNKFEELSGVNRSKKRSVTSSEQQGEAIMLIIIAIFVVWLIAK